MFLLFFLPCVFLPCVFFFFWGGGGLNQSFIAIFIYIYRICSAVESGDSERPMPRMRLSAAGQRTAVDGVPQIGGHYVLAFLQGAFELRRGASVSGIGYGQVLVLSIHQGIPFCGYV